MNKTAIRHSFAATTRYAPDYPGRCGEAVHEALHATPAYGEWRVSDIGTGHNVFVRLASLASLTKHDLRTHGPQGFVPHGRSIEDGLASGEIELVATSGTTGDCVTNVWCQAWWDASETASWQVNTHARDAGAGRHREAILTSPWCTGFPCETGFLSMEERTLGRFLYLSERSDPAAWPPAMMDRMVDELNRFQPAVLEANPSFLARLARHIAQHNLKVRSPGLIILTYEYPSVLHRRQISLVFDSPLASSYGSTEAGYVLMECEAGRMHQVTGSCHVDFIPFKPEQGGPDIGRLLVTTFANPWRSLVRFDMGDIVRIERQAPCPCGRREGLLVTSVEGRTVNLTMTPSGRAVTQGMVDRALAEVIGLTEYQFLQTGAASYTLRVAAAADADPSRVAYAAGAALRTLFGDDAAMGLEVVPAITPDPPGKYRLAKSLEPIDADRLLDERYAPGMS